MRDSALQRILWGLLERAAPLLGPRVARAGRAGLLAIASTSTASHATIAATRRGPSK